jgi:FkbM family methyltransferase
MEYTSQYGQDKWIIEEVFPDLQNGYFVDLAAGDGVFLSNTYVLEKQFNWSGICIEPHSMSFEKLKTNRNCICDNNVIMQDGFELDFIEYETVTDYEHLLSAVNGTSSTHFPVRSKTKRIAKSLNTLLDEYNAPDIINYISLDIEGSEIYVLQDFLPNNKRNVLSWSIEINSDNLQENTILEWMNLYGYEIQKKEGVNGRLGHDYLFTLKDKIKYE